MTQERKNKVLTILMCIQKGRGKGQIPFAPPDQSPCILLPCEICGHQIWASKKKRDHLKLLEDQGEHGTLMCAQCCIKETGASPDELKDINDMEAKGGGHGH